MEEGAGVDADVCAVRVGDCVWRWGVFSGINVRVGRLKLIIGKYKYEDHSLKIFRNSCSKVYDQI